MRFGVPVEAHASSVFTRNMFARFSHALFRSGAFSCESGENGASFVGFIDSAGIPANWRRSFRVEYMEDPLDYRCECKMFEHVGVPCRHILKVCQRCILHDFPAVGGVGLLI